MAQPAYQHRPATDWPTAVDVNPRYGKPTADEGEFDDPASDPFYYGWRDTWVKTPDGQETLQRTPLTYKDLLDPQVGDYIAEDTIHRRVTKNVGDLLEHFYDDSPTVAVWSDLKIAFKIPGLTTGPAPDICVVEGVEDRDRRRSSFSYREEPGKIRLAIEMVSKSSLRKDYQDIFEIYNRMEVEEYIVIHPVGFYPDGPFELRGWRRDPQEKRLRPFPPDQEGRLHSRTTGTLLGTEAEGYGLLIWNAQTGKLLRTANEERAEQEEEARSAAEVVNEKMATEIERLQAQLQELRGDP